MDLPWCQDLALFFDLCYNENRFSKEETFMNDEEKKELEVVSGDGSNLTISPVYDHLNAGKPKCEDDKPKNIVIPQVHAKPEKKYDIDDYAEESEEEETAEEEEDTEDIFESEED